MLVDAINICRQSHWQMWNREYKVSWPISITYALNPSVLYVIKWVIKEVIMEITIRLNVTKPEKVSANPSGSYKISIDNIR